MQADVRFSSKRFLLTLMLCACSVILLQNHDLSENTSFTARLLAVFTGLGGCFLAFLPSVLLRSRRETDVLTLARQRTPRIKIVLMCFYALYFLYTAVYFLLPYTDMFRKKYFPGITPCMIAALLLIACVYAARKGVNVITRFGIFLFFFAMVTNLLMFGGSLSELDFRLYGFELQATPTGFIKDALYFVTPVFIAVIYGCLSGETRHFRFRQPIFALLFTGVKYALVLFFIRFTLGDYASRQEYETFVLSRVAHFAGFAGIESFYLALSTLSVFMITALLLCCAVRGTGRDGDLKILIPFAAAIFFGHLAADYFDSFKELLTDATLFVILSAAAAVLPPLIYLFIGRDRYASKTESAAVSAVSADGLSERAAD